MKRSPLMIGLAGLALLSPVAFGDTILGVYAGVGVWQTDIEGNANDVGSANVLNINDEFGSVEEDSNFIYAALEHPVPLIPNVLIQQTDASSDQTATLTSTVTIDGTTFAAGQDVNATVDFSHTDITLYYEILDNWINVDIGLTARSFDGEFALALSSAPFTSDSVDLDATIPMLYGKGRVDLPFTGFYVTATGNYVSIGDVSVTDFAGGVGYQSDGWVLDLGFEVGLRTFTLEVDDVSDIDADIDLSGAYAAFTLHF